MIRVLKLYITLFFVLLHATEIKAQTSDYIYQQFTTEDGLPSNECHEVFQDSRGYIWVGTDNGLVRYDGYEFKRYGTAKGLGEEVVFEIQEDTDSTLWVAGLRGKVFLYDYKQDIFHAYKYQNLIDSLSIGLAHSFIEEMIVEDSSLTLTRDSYGILNIAKDGFIGTKKPILSDSRNIDLNIRDEHRLLGVSGPKGLNDTVKVIIERKGNIYKSWDINPNTIGRPNFNQAIYQDTLLTNICGELRVIADAKLLYTESLSIGEFSITKKNRSVFCLLDDQGVRLYDKLSTMSYNTIIDNVSATGFIEDDQGSYWITTLQNGLFYIKNPNLKYFDLQGQSITSVLSNDSLILACTSNGDIYIGKEEMYQIDTTNSPHTNIFYNPYKKEFIWSDSEINISFYNFLSKEYKMAVGHTIKTMVFTKKENYLLNNIGSLVTFDEPKEITKDMQNNYWETIVTRPNSLKLLNGCIWIGEINGLIVLDKQDINQQDTIAHLKGIRVEDIELRDSIMVLGTKGHGVNIYTPNDKSHYFINTSHGLIDDYIEDIHIDHQGSIWVATLSGVSRISLSDSLQYTEIDNYSISHGLPCRDVYHIAEHKGNIIAATGKGLVKLTESKRQPSNEVPIIQSIWVQDSLVDHTTDITMDYDQNDIKINYLTINHAHANDMYYRYRLDEGLWQITKSREIYLTNLPSGYQRLDIQSQNQDGKWSDSTSLQFLVKSPWWEWWSFKIVALILFCSIIYYLYNKRINRIESQLSLEREIRDLEKSALQAQMNPHFIFNCLNSIQSFIMDNDKESAMEYLGKFARLIRLNLRASAESIISLEEELTLLDSYLSLEQLRLNDLFDYSITLSDISDPTSLYIPPMLIQPFVENAVIHGMKTKKSNGNITVSFLQSGSFLKVKIQDNGSPNVDRLLPKESSKKSYGVSITQRRLAHNNEKNRSNFDIQYSDSGTTVDLQIKL